MKRYITVGGVLRFIFVVAVAAVAAFNLAIHIKSGEAEALFTPETQVEVESPAETPAE